MKRRKRDTSHLIERVSHPANLTIACKDVVRNKGAGDVAGMKVSELKHHLDLHRKQLIEEVENYGYLPQPIRDKEIPKGGGKYRLLDLKEFFDKVDHSTRLQLLYRKIKCK